MPSMLFEIRASGLARKSTAPSSRARITLLLSEREEMTRTGVGRSFISHRRNVKPSMFGISRSRVITSGYQPKRLADGVHAVGGGPDHFNAAVARQHL